MCAKEIIIPEGERKVEWLILLIGAMLLTALGLGIASLIIGVNRQAEEMRLASTSEMLSGGAKAIIERKIEAERVAREKIEKETRRQENLKTHKLVALTFDDGPSWATTPRLLDILAEKGVKVTFFVVGSRVRGAAEVVQRELAEGHEVGSHTTNHVNFNKVKTAVAVQNEMAAMREIFTTATGRAPQIMRPPYGNGIRSAVVVNNVRLPMIHWSVDTLDWKYKDPASVQERALAEVFDGAIILMHDIHPTTVDAVAGLIDALRAQGYECATISELAAIRGVDMTAGRTYFYFKP